MNVYGKKVTLRAPETHDIELLNKWANDTDIWRVMGGWHFPYSRLSTERWLSNLNNDDPAGLRFCIDTRDHGLIGTASLIEIDWKNRHAWHGIMLGDKEIRGAGFGLDTVMAIMRYAFDELGLTRLDGGMIETNTRSISFYTKSCGWEIEGRRRNWFYSDGRYLDHILVGVTRERYRQLVEETGYWND